MEIESLSLLVYVWIGNGWKGGRIKTPTQRESELLNYIVYRVHLQSRQRRRSMWRSVRRKVEIETPLPLRTLYPWRLLKRRNSWFIFTSSKQKNRAEASWDGWASTLCFADSMYQMQWNVPYHPRNISIAAVSVLTVRDHRFFQSHRFRMSIQDVFSHSLLGGRAVGFFYLPGESLHSAATSTCFFFSRSTKPYTAAQTPSFHVCTFVLRILFVRQI